MDKTITSKYLKGFILTFARITNKWGGIMLNAMRFNETNTTLDPISMNFTNGDYILVNDNHLLSLGINAKQNGTIDIDALRCKLTCKIINTNQTENDIRLWSNASIWPNDTLPFLRDIVPIPNHGRCSWTLTLLIYLD